MTKTSYLLIIYLLSNMHALTEVFYESQKVEEKELFK